MSFGWSDIAVLANPFTAPLYPIARVVGGKDMDAVNEGFNKGVNESFAKAFNNADGTLSTEKVIFNATLPGLMTLPLQMAFGDGRTPEEAQKISETTTTAETAGVPVTKEPPGIANDDIANWLAEKPRQGYSAPVVTAQTVPINPAQGWAPATQPPGGGEDQPYDDNNLYNYPSDSQYTDFTGYYAGY